MIALCYVPMSWAMINCFGVIRVINGQDALAYRVSGQFPLIMSQQHLVVKVF